MAPQVHARFDSGDSEPVQRFDVATMGRVRKTSQGFIEVEATITRTGIFEYKRADGTTRRELRLPDEVFAPGSMATLRHAPVTDMHKGGMVNPENVKDLQIGMTVGEARRDGAKLTNTLLIQDAAAIQNVMGGRRREISAGYNCRLDETPGTLDGKQYDVIQRGIIYNHVSIGPGDWARGGPEMQIHLDGGDALAEVDHTDATPLFLFIQKQINTLNIDQIELAKRARIDGVRMLEIAQGFDPPTADELQALAEALDTTVEELRKLVPVQDAKDPTPETLPMKKITINLDGISYEIELAEPLAATFKQQIDKLRTTAGESTERADGLATKLEAAEGDLKKTKERLDEVEAPAFVEKRIKDRVDLCDRARKVLGEDVKLDGLSDLDIMKKTLETHDKDAKFDGGDDEIRGIFKYVTDKVEPKDKGSNLDAAHRAVTPKPGEKGDELTGQQRMDKNNAEAATKPMTYSKQQPAA